MEQNKLKQKVEEKSHIYINIQLVNKGKATCINPLDYKLKQLFTVDKKNVLSPFGYKIFQQT